MKSLFRRFKIVFFSRLRRDFFDLEFINSDFARGNRAEGAKKLRFGVYKYMFYNGKSRRRRENFGDFGFINIDFTMKNDQNELGLSQNF